MGRLNLACITHQYLVWRQYSPWVVAWMTVLMTRTWTWCCSKCPFGKGGLVFCWHVRFARVPRTDGEPCGGQNAFDLGISTDLKTLTAVGWGTPRHRSCPRQLRRGTACPQWQIRQCLPDTREYVLKGIRFRQGKHMWRRPSRDRAALPNG